MVGKNLYPQTSQFTGWQSYGDANVTNPFSLTTTLILHAPNPTLHYSGVVNLSLRTPSQIHSVTVTIHTFVDYGTGTGFANVTICTSSSSCPYSGLGNQGRVSLQSNTTYEFTGHPVSGFSVKQWTTNTGSIANSTLVTAQIYVQYTGIVSLIIQGDASAAGYFNAPQMSGQPISSASAYITVPVINNTNFDGDAVWVGIGGFGLNLSLWQAGFEVINGSIQAFWEGVPSNGNSTPVSNSTMIISPGNVLLVTVSTSAGTSYATVSNLNNSEVWKISSAFTPSTTSADWMVEPYAPTPFGAGQPVLFQSLEVNLALASLEGCYLATYHPIFHKAPFYPSLLNEGPSGNIFFTIA